MNQVMHWLSMGGYGVYIWSTYAVVFMVLGLGLCRARSLRLRTKRLLIAWFNRVT